jgi:poly-gamma-glutamate capsule biosynthesis protein CapA/YwtB (metallophosphatase superfamily)
MRIPASLKAPLLLITAVGIAGCGPAQGELEINLVVTGQSLIKKDPRLYRDDPFGSLRPIIQAADAAFTNFEMAVGPEETRCGISEDYETSLGEPALSREERPGNTDGPHAVDASVMAFLADLGFDLMSLSNNHAWDLGDCGIAETREVAAAQGVTFAGTGPDVSSATAPAFLDVEGVRIGLMAATTSHDERSLIHHAVNGVWTGRQDDWDRNLAAVRDAAAQADFVLFYHHFQIDEDEFAEVLQGDTTNDGHQWVEDVLGWQTEFARAVLDAGASVYLGNGYRAFDGIEIYNGKPLIRQVGGLAYQGLTPVLGHYDEHRPWEGFMAEMAIRNGAVERIEFIPLDLDEGETYRSEYDDLDFLIRRGLAEVATGDLADSILIRLRDLSAAYGTSVTIEDGRAILEFR